MDNKNIYDVVRNLETNNHKNYKNRKRRGLIKSLTFIISCALIGGVAGAGITFMVGQNEDNIENNLNITEVSSKEEKEVLTISEAYAKVSPAVVTVSAKGLEGFNGFFMQETEGIGSGFIISEQGHVLTNYHVIEGAKDVSLTLSDGTEVNSIILNYDEEQDIAMLKIQDDIKMPSVAELGNSNILIPGEEVIAIGTPLSKDFSQTVTNGIISALNRNVTTEDGNTLKVIQTNTAINPGNSGGPLVNTRGEVIGINTLKISGEAEGIGFSIPIDDIKGQIEALSKPVLNLGITIRIVDKETAKQVNLEEGLYILEVAEFSPAELGGIKPGDLIVKVDGERVKDFEGFDKIKDKKEEGDSMKLTIIREGKTKIIDVVLTAE